MRRSVPGHAGLTQQQRGLLRHHAEPGRKHDDDSAAVVAGEDFAEPGDQNLRAA
jgi:hypothetical protein